MPRFTVGERTILGKNMALSRIRYLQGYGSVFDGPHRWNNLFLLSVCNLIPILGHIVVSGYCYLVLTPLFLRAGLAQDFVKAFDLAWIIDFDRRVGLDAVLAMLFMACTGIMIFYLGYAMCLIGVIPAITIITICSANLSSQLYNLYLARGGIPVPMKPPPAPPQLIRLPPEPNPILPPTIPGEIA